MRLFFEGTEYELARTRRTDGAVLNVSVVDPSIEPVAEVVYADADGSMTFTTFKAGVPFEVIEALMSNAREAFTPVGGSESPS